MKPSYPYYVIPDIESLPSITDGEERKTVVRRIAALIGDPSSLREILGLEPEEFASFYPDMLPPDLSTADTIDSFLNKYGDPKVASSRQAQQMEELVPLPPADYDLSQIETSPLIIDEKPTTQKIDPIPELPDPLFDEKSKPETPALSESLARAMIKNGNYRKALEIITDLSLKNPKKSIYFADQ
ncbi:MAG: hypothetical protein K2N05_11015, partial [Muribaculaceae bacterium]|nr:hypothetical protein [Muribaculaceae bacterium]